VFLRLLSGHDVQTLVDVRRYPGSRRMPRWNTDSLERTLERAQIAYLHIPELGGRRRPLPGSPNGGWRVEQFRGYADHLQSGEFRAGLERLTTIAGRERTVVMCAEAQWRRCHRRLLADALLARGWTVLHVGPGGEVERHRLPDFAILEHGHLSYPPAQAALDV
jgi:uncharacterized protein (DUF488 family)